MRVLCGEQYYINEYYTEREGPLKYCQKSPQKKTKKNKKKREREEKYLMYYLNEDGKRVYTLKVRRLYYRAFVCFFLSFVVGEDVWRCLLLDPKKIVLAFFLVSNSSI